MPLQFPRRPLAVERFIARPGFRETRTYRILFADGSSSYGLVALSEAWHAGHRRRAGPEVRILGAAQTGVGGGRTTSGHPGPRRCYLHRWPTGRASPPSWPRSSRQCQAQGTPGMTRTCCPRPTRPPAFAGEFVLQVALELPDRDQHGRGCVGCGQIGDARQ